MSDDFQPAGFDTPRAQSAERNEQRVEKLLDEANAALAAISDHGASSTPGVRPFRLPDFGASRAVADSRVDQASRGGEVEVRIEFGRAEMRREDIDKLRAGSVVPLEDAVGESVQVLINDRLVARGEVVILEDCFCVRIAEVIDVRETPGRE